MATYFELSRFFYQRCKYSRALTDSFTNNLMAFMIKLSSP